MIILPEISVTLFSSPVLANSLPPFTWLWFDTLISEVSGSLKIFGWVFFRGSKGKGEESSVYKLMILFSNSIPFSVVKVIYSCPLQINITIAMFQCFLFPVPLNHLL